MSPLAAAHGIGFLHLCPRRDAPGGAAWLCQGGFELPGGQIHSRSADGLLKGRPRLRGARSNPWGDGVFTTVRWAVYETTWRSGRVPKPTTDWVMTIES